MKSPTVHHLLLFLVFWSFANDAWAAVTPEPSDDVLAAQDNLYLHVNPDARWTARFVKAWPALYAGLEGWSVLSPEPDLELCTGLGQGKSTGVRRLIYLLMTLRR